MGTESSLLDRIAISGTEYPHRPLEELLEVALRLGVKYLELWIPHNFEFDDISRVEKELSRRGLEAVVISTWTQLNLPGDLEPRRNLILQSISAAKALGARTVNTYFGAHPSRSPEESIHAYREAIMPLVDVAGKTGITITLENEFETTGRDVTRRAEGVRSIIETVGSSSFKANYDPCNFCFAGEEPYPFAYRLIEKNIGYVHLKDGMKYCDGLYPHPGEGFLWKDLSGDYLCCPLGDGAINYAPLLRDIVQSPYDGYLALEPHVHPDRLFETFQVSLRFLRKLLLSSDEGGKQ